MSAVPQRPFGTRTSVGTTDALRVAVLTHASAIVGGAEAYLDSVLPRLCERGHRVALCTETVAPSGERRIAGAAEHEPITIAGVDELLGSLERWQPDVAFLHGLDNVNVERAVGHRWPSVFFAHTYHGTCISGGKTHTFPAVTPCVRTLGPGCLLRYLPRRCGGLSPVSMLQAYRLQQERRALLASYARVLTLSRHMRDEFVRHGAVKEHCHVLPHFGPAPATPRRAPASTRPVRLIWVGRMEHLKGAHVFLDTLPLVAQALRRAVRGVLVGDGRRHFALEQRAVDMATRHPNVEVEFRGWLPRSDVPGALGEADVLVVPSLWPEPFGLIGPEAAALGIPAAAFDVGGISEWLKDGTTGYLARGPRTAGGLADAVVRCVRESAEYERLSAGAVALAGGRTLDEHVDALEEQLSAVANRSVPRGVTVA